VSEAPADAGKPVRRGFLATARGQLHTLLSSHLSPGQLFAAVVVGTTIGCSPLYGLHLLLCIAAAALLRLNPTAMYAAANISVPPMIPLLGFLCVQTGERLLHGRFLPLGVAEFRAMAHGPGGAPALMTRFFADWLLGGVPVGLALGATVGGVVFAVARARRRGGAQGEQVRAAAIDAALAAAARLYRAAPRRMAGYAAFKYRLDPVYRRVGALVPEDSLTVDVGTGLGMLPVLLALLGGGRRALGLDWDSAKLAAGRAAAAGIEAVELREGDARGLPLPPCDVVTLIDVLHYHAELEQRALLAAAAAALRPGGLLLVREGDGGRGGGARFTRGLEALAVRTGWNRGAGGNRFRPVGELVAELSGLGLTVEVEELAGALHPGNVLIVARKGGGD